jgi:hypothetical protein
MRRLWQIGISVLVGVLVFLGCMYWYRWSATPLSHPEIESYLARISAQTQVPGGRHDLPALRRFLEQDDGQPVYTVNLYRFRETADYPEGSGFSGSGIEAYGRFSQIMVGLMIPRASHPAFSSDWSDQSSAWDRVVVVRYRSRRDLVDLFATDAFADASLHKWASIEAHNRMVVRATDLPSGEQTIALASALVAMLTLIAQMSFAQREVEAIKLS